MMMRKRGLEDDVAERGGGRDGRDAERDAAHVPSRPESGELCGTSMPMLLAVLAHTPRQFEQDRVVSVFNATTGRVVGATLARIESEVRRLRGMGVRDADYNEGLCMPCPQVDEKQERDEHEDRSAAPPSSVDGAVDDKGNVFTNRAELLRHLTGMAKKKQRCSEGIVTVGRKPDADEVGLQARVDVNGARAISTSHCAVDARVGLGGRCTRRVRQMQQP